MRQSDDRKGDEDLLHLDPETLPFGEQEEDTLRGMMGLPVIVDLDWFPEGDEDEENEELDIKTLHLQLIAAESMRGIESLDHEEPYEQLQWNEEMVEQKCCLVPTEIHMVQGPTGEYPRFWGYFCQLYPEYESVEARKATISLPSTLFKLISMHGERFQDFVADPLEDSTVFMIMTTYFGLEEYEVDGEKRRVHKFWDTHLVEGHRSE